jgi:hypothetical protein
MDQELYEAPLYLAMSGEIKTAYVDAKHKTINILFRSGTQPTAKFQGCNSSDFDGWDICIDRERTMYARSSSNPSLVANIVFEDCPNLISLPHFTGINKTLNLKIIDCAALEDFGDIEFERLSINGRCGAKESIIEIIQTKELSLSNNKHLAQHLIGNLLLKNSSFTSQPQGFINAVLDNLPGAYKLISLPTQQMAVNNSQIAFTEDDISSREVLKALTMVYPEQNIHIRSKGLDQKLTVIELMGRFEKEFLNSRALQVEEVQEPDDYLPRM